MCAVKSQLRVNTACRDRPRWWMYRFTCRCEWAAAGRRLDGWALRWVAGPAEQGSGTTRSRQIPLVYKVARWASHRWRFRGSKFAWYGAGFKLWLACQTKSLHPSAMHTLHPRLRLAFARIRHSILAHVPRRKAMGARGRLLGSIALFAISPTTQSQSQGTLAPTEMSRQCTMVRSSLVLLLPRWH